MAQATESTHIRKAYLTSLSGGVIELRKDWKAIRNPPITMEGKAPATITLHTLNPREFADESGYFVDARGNATFVFYPDRYSHIDYTDLKIYVAGEFNGWQKAIGEEKWELLPETIDGRKAYVLKRSFKQFDLGKSYRFKFVSSTNYWFSVDSNAPNAVSDGSGNWNFLYSPKVTGRHRFAFTFRKPVELYDDHFLLYQTRKEHEKVRIQPGDFFFELSSDKELGAVLSERTTEFRLFAPRAKWAKVGYFKDLDKMDEISWLLMKRDDDFVWEASVPDNLEGWYYWFRVQGPDGAFSVVDPEFNILDPYAKATVGREGPGIVVDMESRIGKAMSARNPQWQDLVIMEGHVRDFTARLPKEESVDDKPLGFLDLASYSQREDFYPKKVGVNAIELQPVQENDSRSYGEYHWGYMTANFFSPHSGYGKSPDRGSQVEDFRTLVDTLHEQGFSVILDVVYNHVGEPAHLMFVDKLYYFHCGSDGSLSNWSGCGNDFRSDAPMARRIIVDSLKHLVTYYGVDGFRFDLADLVGKPALMEVERELKKIRPDIILIAEPWSFRGHIGRDLRDTGYASWNDGYRESLKKYVRGMESVGAITWFMKGSPIHYASWPSQTVNYVESHDDRTWLDDITENGGHDGTRPTANDIARTRMMVSILMMSVGMPMLHAGMDFLLTKNGVKNTYQDGGRNALDYLRAHSFPGSVRFFADWVRFRRSKLGALVRHYDRVSDDFFAVIDAHQGNAFACVYNASGELGPDRLLFAANPMGGPITIDLGEWEELQWTQIANQERFLDDDDRLWANEPHKGLLLPKMSSGLWNSKI